MPALSILIPARNELFLARTVQDILENMREDTEIIICLDGQWSDPPIEDHPRVHLIYHSESIGQRAAVNEAAKLSSARYVLKCDAHCSFAPGFDTVLLNDMQDDWTMVPIMRNLHVFDWICPDGHRRYQGPSGPCKECGKETVRDIVWIAKPSPQSTSYCFDSTPKFQYFRDFAKRPEGKGDLTETMSLQGSCFMMTRDKFFELGVCDESFGSWGSQGIEVSCKVWLSGGRVVCNHKTWYAHEFRTQGGDFSFPYHLSQSQVDYAKSQVRELFFNNAWPKQIHPLSWLVEKFWPILGWTKEDLESLKAQEQTQKRETQKMDTPSVGLLYYTCNSHPQHIEMAVRTHLNRIRNGHELGCVSRMPTDFGDWNIVIEGKRGPETLHKQILAGLERMKSDVVFMVESDVLYHPEHFIFIPPRKDVFYYNEATYKVNAETGHAVFYYTKQVSGLCAYRELLLEHYRKRLARIEAEGKFDWKIGFEPGCHRPPRGIDNYKAERWMSRFPNVDIRHDKVMTKTRWSPELFRNPRSCQGWTEVSAIPGWGQTEGQFNQLISDVENGTLSLYDGVNDGPARQR